MNYIDRFFNFRLSLHPWDKYHLVIIYIYFLQWILFYLFIFLTSLLEYNCFTMVCQFLLYNKVNQLYIYIYPHISSLLCLSPPSLSHPSGGHKAPSWSPCALQLLPLAISFTFGSVYMSMPLSHFIPAYPPPPPVSSSPFSTFASLFLSCP